MKPAGNPGEGGTPTPMTRSEIIRWCVKQARKDYQEFHRNFFAEHWKPETLKEIRRGFLLERLADEGIISNED